MTGGAIGPAVASAGCFGVHLLLFGAAAPFATALEDTGAALASGRRPPPPMLAAQRFRHGFALIPSVLASRRLSASPPLAVEAALAAFLSTCLAAFLVPGFATGLPFGRAGGLVLVLVLVAGSRIARLVASAAAADAADTVEDIGRALLAIGFLVPAGIVAALLGATVAGSTRLDALAAAAPLAPAAPRAALAAALLLLLLADRLTGRDRAAAVASPIAGTLLEAERALRFVVFLSLATLVLPPAAIADATDGVAALALSIPVFLGKLALLAFLAGALRPTAIGRAPSGLVGVAAFLALLGAVLVVVGDTVE